MVFLPEEKLLAPVAGKRGPKHRMKIPAGTHGDRGGVSRQPASPPRPTTPFPQRGLWLRCMGTPTNKAEQSANRHPGWKATTPRGPVTGGGA
jgi:hypothetical protein